MYLRNGNESVLQVHLSCLLYKKYIICKYSWTLHVYNQLQVQLSILLFHKGSNNNNTVVSKHISALLCTRLERDTNKCLEMKPWIDTLLTWNHSQLMSSKVKSEMLVLYSSLKNIQRITTRYSIFFHCQFSNAQLTQTHKYCKLRFIASYANVVLDSVSCCSFQQSYPGGLHQPIRLEHLLSSPY